MSKEIDNVYQINNVGLSPKRSTSYGCAHGSIVVHEHTRSLECGGCGKIMDAFDYMYKWANKQQNIVWRNQTLDSQIRDKEKRLSDLHRQETNIKARIRTAKNKLTEIYNHSLKHKG